MVLTFSSGVSDGDTECLAIIITDDDALETEETFSVTLTVSDDDVMVIGTANVTIVTITGIVTLVSLSLSLVLYLH